MIAALRLGLRLGTGTGPNGRRPVALAATATATGTAVFLVVLAAARADRLVNPDRYGDAGLAQAMRITVAVIGLQIVGLIAAAGRVAATARSRRLASLRLLGVSAAHTRVIAATESAVAAFAGAIAGVAVAELVRVVVPRVALAGWSASHRQFDPEWWGRVLTVTAVLAATVVVGIVPDRLDPRHALRAVRGETARTPSVLRVLPLVAGAAGCLWFRARPWNDGDAVWLVGSIAVLGVGVILVVPTFVWLVGDLLVRLGRSGVTTIAGRRLQAQPASMNRVVTGLLLGLFIVTAARFVVVAFETTPQYQGATRQLEEQQMATWSAVLGDHDQIVDRLAAHGMSGPADRVLVLPRLAPDDAECLAPGGPGPVSGCGGEAIVATCEQVAAIYPGASGCRPGFVQTVVEDPDESSGGSSGEWIAVDRSGAARSDARVSAPVSASPIVVGRGSPYIGSVITVDAGPLLLPAEASALAVAIGPPGRDLPARVQAAGYPGAMAPWDATDHDRVASMRMMLLAVGITVVAIGLVTFAIAAVDRATQRRRHVVAMQLAGVPPGVLRRVQMIEAAIPIVGGSALAIGSGVLAGSAYLGIDDLPTPWRSILVLSLAAVVGGIVVAGLTVAAANPTIDADTIRRT